ncbi:MAG: glycosyltransferase family 4 protein [Planctomycetaceae bacterium]
MAELQSFVALIDEVRPDVVYVNTLVSLAGVVAARRRRLPCVWHIRELFDDVGGEMHIPACGGRPLVRRLLKKLATRRVAISRSVAENILESTDPSVVEIVPNAVGQNFFEVAETSSECRARFGLPPGVPLIGVPGTLRPMKGHPFFFEAAALIAQARPDCVFAITGTGEAIYETQLRRQTEQLGLADRVRFLGNITVMPQFYRACDVVCVPSVAEPFGRTVIEAFAVGTPVVATAVGGIRETIEDRKTGLLAAYGDVPALCGALLRILSDQEFARVLANAARQTAREQYTAERYQASLRAIAASVAADSGKTSHRANERTGRQAGVASVLSREARA